MKLRTRGEFVSSGVEGPGQRSENHTCSPAGECALYDDAHFQVVGTKETLDGFS